MNTVKRLPRADSMKGLSPIERKFLCLARHHRADYLRLLKRLKSSVRRNWCRALMITACVMALLATTSINAQAAVSAPALFNEANAAQRDGRIGAAILGYERARFLAPHDSAVEQNLRIAREKAGVDAPAVSVWQYPAHWLGFNGLALLGSFAVLMSCALFFGKNYLPTLSRRTATLIAAACGAMMLFSITSLALRWSELDRAVIQNAKTIAHIAPAANAQSTFELKAGDLVTAKGEHRDFVLVRTPDQRSGWVNKSDLERVIPTTNLSPM
jgi:hypothetical protein